MTDDWSSTEFLRITGLLNLQKSSKNSSAAQEFMLWCFGRILRKERKKKAKKGIPLSARATYNKQTKPSEVQEHFLQRSRQSCKINIWVCQPFAIQHWPFKKLPLSPSTPTEVLRVCICCSFHAQTSSLLSSDSEPHFLIKHGLHVSGLICSRIKREETLHWAAGSFILFLR